MPTLPRKQYNCLQIGIKHGSNIDIDKTIKNVQITSPSFTGPIYVTAPYYNLPGSHIHTHTHMYTHTNAHTHKRTHTHTHTRVQTMCIPDTHMRASSTQSYFISACKPTKLLHLRQHSRPFHLCRRCLFAQTRLWRRKQKS